MSVSAEIPGFSALAFDDPGSAVRVVALRYHDPGDPRAALEARVAPGQGANLFSLRAGPHELLAQPPSLAELNVAAGGTPIMFPSPNRVRGAVFSFEGQQFSFPANHGPNFIHGLVRRRPWQNHPPSADAEDATLVTFIDWDPDEPEFAHFPLPHRLTVKYRLHRGGLDIGYRVDNRADQRLPFGFGLHPWFRVPGDRGEVLLHVPAGQRMEAESCLPSGRLLPVDGTPFDLRRPTTLAGLDLDDVYRLDPGGHPASFEWREHGLRVTLGASPDFTHVVVFTPPGRAVFCIENQTCSTDAHNLHDRGLAEESHLQVVPPGGHREGCLRWQIAWASPLGV